MSEDAGRETTVADAETDTVDADPEAGTATPGTAATPFHSQLSRATDMAQRPGFRSAPNSRSKNQRKKKRKGKKKR